MIRAINCDCYILVNTLILITFTQLTPTQFLILHGDFEKKIKKIKKLEKCLKSV